MQAASWPDTLYLSWLPNSSTKDKKCCHSNSSLLRLITQCSTFDTVMNVFCVWHAKLLFIFIFFPPWNMLYMWRLDNAGRSRMSEEVGRAPSKTSFSALKCVMDIIDCTLEGHFTCYDMLQQTQQTLSLKCDHQNKASPWSFLMQSFIFMHTHLWQITIDMPDGIFPKSVAFISRIHLVKSP